MGASDAFFDGSPAPNLGLVIGVPAVGSAEVRFPDRSFSPVDGLASTVPSTPKRPAQN
jgi:hypothetical protein